MLYQPKKGYPHLKSSLAKAKTPSIPDSSQQTGRRKRSNSQTGSHHKRPKSTKNISGSRKYKPAHHGSIQNDSKLHSISHSIDHTTLVSNERPSSVVESLRYAKADRKSKHIHPEVNKESISTSIDVPSIELHSNNDGANSKAKHIQNHIIYQKAAEMIASNFHKGGSKNASSGKNTSNSQKVLRSTSRSGKAKSKSKVKQQFKKSGSNFEKSLSKSKENMHRKSKSDAKKIAYEIFNRNFRTNPKLRKSNYIEKALNDKSLAPHGPDNLGKESPLGIPNSLMMGQINQNWIDSINHQIEENGKNLLDSINKVKKSDSQSLSAANRKRRKNKNSRPQSSHYINIPQP